MSESLNIPEKSHFKLNEVCSITSIKPYVLRFWESEFDEISPIVSSSGQKLYEHKDIEAIAFIKKLLFEDKLTVDQAKKELHYRLNAQSSKISSGSYDEEAFIADEKELQKPSELKNFEKTLDVEGLVIAKQKLSDAMSLAESLKRRHNW